MKNTIIFLCVAVSLGVPVQKTVCANAKLISGMRSACLRVSNAIPVCRKLQGLKEEVALPEKDPALQLVYFNPVAKQFIEDTFAQKGYSVFFGSVSYAKRLGFRSNNDLVPNMGVLSYGNKVCFLINKAAGKAFSVSNSREGFHADQVKAIVLHELGHVVHNHTVKKVILDEMRTPCAGLAALTSFCVVSPSLSFLVDSPELFADVQLAAGAMSYGIGKKIKENWDYVTNAYRRYAEVQADNYMLQSGDKNLVKARIDFFHTMKDREENYKKRNPNFLLDHEEPLKIRTYPTKDQRIQLCVQALKKIEDKS